MNKFKTIGLVVLLSIFSITAQAQDTAEVELPTAARHYSLPLGEEDQIKQVVQKDNKPNKIAKKITKPHAPTIPQVEKPSSAENEKAFLKMEANKELKIGLQLYQEFDDYRAITALKRYRILDASLQSRYFSNLVIGQIYQRNSQPELSAFAYENAQNAAPDLYSKTFAHLLANQQSCVALSFYFDCSKRLEGLKNEKLDDVTRDLVDYQSLFVDVVLRKEINTKRASLIRSSLLKDKAAGLLLENEKFENLSLKSPVLSGVLSAVLPGSGQLYNGRPWDALLSLSFNAAFAGATYYSYKELDNIPLTIISGVAFLGFYIGNITNAVTDSQRINAETYLKFFENLKSNYWARVHFQIDKEHVSFGYRFDWPGPRPGLTPSDRPAKAAQR